MTEDLIEQQLRAALRETASTLESTRPARIFEPTRRPTPRRPRALLAAAVAAALAVVGVGAVVAVTVLRDDPSPPASVRGESAEKEVPLASLPDEDVDFEVFLRSNATEPEIQAVHDALLASPAVERFAYVDRDAALELYREYTSCNPALSDDVTADVLPPSFRVQATGDDAGQLRAFFDVFPGVDEVAASPSDPRRPERRACSGSQGSGPEVPLTEGTDNGVAWRLLGSVEGGEVCVAMEVAEGSSGHCGSLEDGEVIAAGGGSRPGLGGFSSGFARKGVVSVRLEPRSGAAIEVPTIGQDAGFDIDFFVALLPDYFNFGHDLVTLIALDGDGHELGRTAA